MASTPSTTVDQAPPLGPTQRLTLAAMFIAISVVVGRLPVPPIPFGGYLRFDGFPVILSGLVLGPGSGFMVGGLADVLSYLLKATGAYNPIFTLTRALTGCIPALIVGRRGASFPWLFLAILIGQMITKAVIIPIVRIELYGFPPLVISVPKAVLEELVHSALYAWLSLPVVRAWLRHRNSDHQI